MNNCNTVVKLPPLAPERLNPATLQGETTSGPTTPVRTPKRSLPPTPNRQRTPAFEGVGGGRWQSIKNTDKPAKHSVSSEERVLSQSETAGSEASLSQLPADGGPARHAVSFELLRRYAHWLRKWIGPEAFAAVSTHDVVHGVGAAWGQGPHGRGYAPPRTPWCMRAITSHSKMSLVQTLSDPTAIFEFRDAIMGGLMAPPFGDATHYVCHNWQNSFAELLETLEQFDVEEDTGVPIYFWLDVFAINQHDPGGREANPTAMLKDMVAIMQRMRYFLLCADPWGRTSPLRRVWCVFEMLVWIDLGGSITLGLTRRGHHTLMTAAADVGDPRVRSQYDQLILETTGINMLQAKAAVPIAEKKIKEHIRASIGFTRLDSIIKGDIKALLDHASAPGRLRASCAQLQGSHPLEPGIAFNNLLGLVRRNYSNLTAINLSRCRACSMPYNDIRLLEAALVENTTVMALNFAGSSMGPILCEAMAGVLMNSPESRLQTLIMDDNLLVRRGNDEQSEDVIGMESLAAALEVNTTLTSLSLKDNFLGPNAIALLADGLYLNQTLTSVDLGGNCLQHEGAEALALTIAREAEEDGSAVHISSGVQDLNLWRAGLGVEGAWDIADTVRERSHRPVLLCRSMLAHQSGALAQMQLSPTDTVLLASDLTFNQHITALDLSNNFIGAEGAAALARAFAPTARWPYNRSLKALDLSGNWLYDEGAIAILAPLTPDPSGIYNNSLTALNVAGARIGAKGAAALAAAFTPSRQGWYNTAITSLNLSKNDLCAGGAVDENGEQMVDMSGLQALSTALTNADNKSLTILNLWECSFTEGAARTVTTSLAGRRALSVEEGSASLDTVRLCGNILDVAALDLTARKLTAAAAVLVACDLVTNSCLQTLDLSDNVLGTQGAVAIAAALVEDENGLMNHTLECLIVANNSIGADGALEGFAAFGEVLAKNPHLTHLDVSGNNMGPAGAVALFAGVAQSGSLKTLALDHNHVVGRAGPEGEEAQEGLEALVRALGENRTLGALSLQDNHIGAVGTSLLVKAISQTTILHTLDVRGNCIVGDCVMELAEAVLASPKQWQAFNAVPLGLLTPQCKVSKLDLHSQRINAVGAVVLATWLTDIKAIEEVMVNAGSYLPLHDVKAGTLTTLRHSMAGLDVESLIVLTSVLMLSGHVRSFNMSGNCVCSLDKDGKGLFDTSGMKLLAECLKYNRSVERVVLGNNRMQTSTDDATSEALKALSDVLKHNVYVHHLDVNNCSLGHAGAEALATGAMLSTRLCTLDISGNHFGPEGARIIADVLLPPPVPAEGEAAVVKEYNRTLQSITLTRGADLPVGPMRNNSIEELSLRYKGIGPEDVMVLAAILQLNTSLKSLDLTGNQICGLTAKGKGEYELRGFEALTHAIRDNTTLEVLKLGGNSMQPAGARLLADAITPNTALNSVVVHAIELPISGLRCHTIEHVDLTAKTGMILEEAIVLGAGVVLSKKVETVTMTPGVPVPVGQLLRFRTKPLTDLISMKLGKMEAAVLGRVMMKCKSLATLNFTDNDLNVVGLLELAEALTQAENKAFSMIRTLDLGYNALCGIHPDPEDPEIIAGTYDACGMETMAHAIFTNQSLAVLSLSGNLLGEPGMGAICKALIPNEENKMSILNTMVLKDCRIGESLEQCKLLAGALSKNFALKSLDLSSNKIDVEGARVLAGGILDNKALTSLILHDNKIGDKGLVPIASAFVPGDNGGRCNRYLSSLNLSGNGITVEGAKSIARSVNTTSGLDYIMVNQVALPVGVIRKSDIPELDLKRSQLKPMDAVVLAAALKLNTNIKSLNLSENHLCGMNEHGAGTYTTEGFMELMDALREGPKSSLAHLDMGNNSICGVYLDFSSRVQGKHQSQAMETLFSVIHEYPAMTSLSLQGNDIGDMGLQKLSQSIETSEILKLTLKFLNVEHNGLTQLPGFLLKPNKIVGISIRDGNHLQYIPPEVLGKGDDAILKYVQEGSYKPEAPAG